MSENVRISARKVQELLAGRTTADALFSEFDGQNGKFQNPFARALKLGLTMEAINLTRLSNMDDDMLEIRFGPPDPAIGKITA